MSADRRWRIGPRRIGALLAAVAVGCALAACGSSATTVTVTRTASTAGTPTGATATPSPTSSTASATTSAVATGTRLPGTRGRRAVPADLAKLADPHTGGGAHAHLAGLQGLSLSQKQGMLLNLIVAYWQPIFQSSHLQLPAAQAVLVGQPASCGSSQITTASTPTYCPGNATLFLTQGTIGAKVEPLGDGALLLLLSDLYGYHVVNALGDLSGKLSAAQLEQTDACLSGAFFYYAEGQQSSGQMLLQPADEVSVTKLITLLGHGGSGAATSAQLTAAFNRGVLQMGPRVCLPGS